MHTAQNNTPITPSDLRVGLELVGDHPGGASHKRIRILSIEPSGPRFARCSYLVLESWPTRPHPIMNVGDEVHTYTNVICAHYRKQGPTTPAVGQTWYGVRGSTTFEWVTLQVVKPGGYSSYHGRIRKRFTGQGKKWDGAIVTVSIFDTTLTDGRYTLGQYIDPELGRLLDEEEGIARSRRLVDWNKTRNVYQRRMYGDMPSRPTDLCEKDDAYAQLRYTTNTLIYVNGDERKQAKTADAKRDLLLTAADGGTMMLVWQGARSSDVFFISDRRKALEVLGMKPLSSATAVAIDALGNKWVKA